MQEADKSRGGASTRQDERRFRRAFLSGDESVRLADEFGRIGNETAKWQAFAQLKAVQGQQTAFVLGRDRFTKHMPEDIVGKTDLAVRYASGFDFFGIMTDSWAQSMCLFKRALMRNRAVDDAQLRTNVRPTPQLSKHADLKRAVFAEEKSPRECVDTIDCRFYDTTVSIFEKRVARHGC